MNTTRLCPSCGKSLAADAPKGLCQECLLKAGFPTAPGTDERPGFEPPSLAELAPKFPQLEILEFLGRGGMGAVYKVRQKQLDRIVALKILPPAIGRDPAFAQRFTREVKALAKLNHPGIVTLYEFGQADGLFFFLMEFVDGVNLRQLLQAGRVEPREALAIVPQICDALQYAHDHGIVHRDIKPENILLDRRGRVKVADFGVAKLMGLDAEGATSLGGQGATGESLTEAGKVMGTPQYMAPEQIQTPAAADHRADIFALGVVFYQMLTGELPGKRLEPPSRKVQVDVRLDEIVLRALEARPDLRYQSAEELKTQVSTLQEQAASSERQTSLDKSSNRMPRILWLPIGLLAMSLISNVALQGKGPWIVDVLLKLGFIFGIRYRSKLAYSATIIAGVFIAPLLAKMYEPLYAFIGVLLSALIVGPLLFSTSWFFPATMTRWKKRSWLGTTAALALAAVFVAIIVSPLALQEVARKAGKHTSETSGIINTPTSGSTRTRVRPPFIARYPHGTVELIAIRPHPATNDLAWLANGERFHGAFPKEDGKAWAANRTMIDIAFRVTSTSGSPSFPQTEYSHETGMGGSFFSEHPESPERLFVQHVACFPGAKQTDVRVGVADGPWEAVITEEVSGELSTDSTISREDGSWTLAAQEVKGAAGDVAVSVRYTRSDKWETRFVLKKADGTLLQIPHGKTDSADGFTMKMVSLRQADVDQARSIELQRRKYEWVEFGEVSLEPGHSTRVHITGIAGLENEDNVAAAVDVVREIVIYDDKSGASNFLFDLDREIFVQPKTPPDMHWTWVKSNGIDLIGGFRAEQRGIVAAGETVAVPVDNASWSEFPTDRLVKQLDGRTAGESDASALTATNGLPSTYLIKTREGSRILLQLTGFVSSPAGTKVRYKRWPQRAASDAQGNGEKWGDVIETILPDPDHGDGKSNRETLHLASGERWNALGDASKEQGRRLRALVSGKGDLFAEYDDFVSKRWAFVSAGLKLSDFPTRKWDDATAADLDDALKRPSDLQKVEHFGAAIVLLPDGLLPFTLAFETREGRCGLLQIMAFDENPRAVKLRYKLVQSGVLPKAEANVTDGNDYKLNLANAVSFEVVGVCRDPRNSKLWWKPDGTPFAEPPAEIVKMPPIEPTHSSRITVKATNEFLIYIRHQWADSWPKDTTPAVGNVWTPRPTDTEFPPHIRDLRSGQVAQHTELICFDEPPASVDYHVEVAPGPWEPIAIYDGKRTRELVNGVMVVCSTPAIPDQRKDHQFEVMHNVNRDIYSLRLIAKLKDGKKEEVDFHSGPLSGTPAKGFAMIHPGDFDPAKVKEYVLERAPLQRGKISGIALKPRQ